MLTVQSHMLQPETYRASKGAVFTKHTPGQNHLLAAIPAAEYQRLLPRLELVPLPLGWTVYETGRKQGYVYFPTNSIICLLNVMEDGV